MLMFAILNLLCAIYGESDSIKHFNWFVCGFCTYAFFICLGLFIKERQSKKQPNEY